MMHYVKKEERLAGLLSAGAPVYVRLYVQIAVPQR